MSKQYGWYYEGEWRLDAGYKSMVEVIDAAIGDMEEGLDYRPIRVGEAEERTLEDFLSFKSFKELARSGRLSATGVLDQIACVISDEYFDSDYGGQMTDAEQQEFDRLVSAGTSLKDLYEFLKEHVELEYVLWCDGVDPFPMSLVDGVWQYGKYVEGCAASIHLDSEEIEDDCDYVCSVSVAARSYGATSLKDAVFLAEALSQHEKKEEEET